MSLRWTSRPLSILSFDTECRPMHYSEWRREDQLTAIAWSWVGEDEVDSRVLKQNLKNERSMLADFLAVYRHADIVTGHYLTKHDLPLINDHCLRFGFDLLKPIRAQDTMRDLSVVKGLGKSQDNLSTTFGIAEEKHHMSGHDWRVANTLSPEGREDARTRVVNDVIQQKALRERLIQAGALQPPALWRP